MFIVRCHVPENLAELFTFLQRVQHDHYRPKSWLNYSQVRERETCIVHSNRDKY